MTAFFVILECPKEDERHLIESTLKIKIIIIIQKHQHLEHDAHHSYIVVREISKITLYIFRVLKNMVGSGSAGCNYF